MAKPLTIAVDIRDLRLAKTGTRTYLEEVYKAFKKMESDELRFHFLDTFLPVYTGTNKWLKLIEHARYQLWKQLFLPLKAWTKSCGIVFCTDNFVPLIHLGYQTIPVFHDAFFFESPGDYGKLWLWLYKKTAVPAARRSPFVITPTAYARQRINHFTHIPNERLKVVYEGPKTLPENQNQTNEVQLLTSLMVKPGNYVLHVGSMFKRKNIPALVEAFGKIKKQGHPNLKLVLAGPKPTVKTDNDYQLILNTIKQADVEQDVVFTGYLSNEALGTLYKNALMYVFPSINEGFGIPILEAFHNDLPVIVADNTCLPEVGGNAVLTFNPFLQDDLFKKMQLLLNDSELRKTMINKGQQRLESFSWQKTATELVDIFRAAKEKRF
ncbi:glycosyltransferase family 4 protein [Mucilaginibacter aquaedulcis]|uniref:glycosyltransferase family 4 protein n=1 Tax=Mucilaginibacter aquaedulcis TaxID=1187081 RepID=UPI0025B43BED|nr:glycosyltransferase family 1 protein [Mucilaginibacter aquaedulcis]MDN3547622.1 glycosyltransferase family 1 protein [Mucilaginibacter aquaedulcis]